MVAAPFYDPERSYSENYIDGPFGLFADGKVFEPVGRHEQSVQKFLGHAVNLPFGIPAGPLINGNFVKAALDKGFDLPIYKTVRTRAYAAHAWPNVLAVHPEGELRPGRKLVADHSYVEPLSITNSFGVPSYPPETWQPDLADAVTHARAGQVVIASFQGTLPDSHNVAEYIADFTLGARMLRETGVKIVEVNLSCPNEGTSALLCFDAARSGAVCEALRNELGSTPLIIKIAYFADDAALRALLTAVGPFIDAVSAINTVSAEIVDAAGAQALPGAGRLSSGVCGACIRWAGLEMATRLAAAREELGLGFRIVGVGGVTHAEDYAAFRAAGADAVMSATGAMWNPLLAEEVKAFTAQPMAEPAEQDAAEKVVVAA